MASSTIAAVTLGTAVVLLAMQPAFAQSLQLNLTNGTSRDLEEFYAAPASGGAEIDILGGAFLPAGNNATFTIANDSAQCAYDLRFAFASGDGIEEAAFNVCENGNFALTD